MTKHKSGELRCPATALIEMFTLAKAKVNGVQVKFFHYQFDILAGNFTLRLHFEQVPLWVLGPI